MGRSKQTMRRPFKVALDSYIEVNVTDPFPSTFIEHCETIPSTPRDGIQDDAPYASEPVAKRRKIENETARSICVARGKIQLSRRYVGDADKHIGKVIRDVEAYLHVRPERGTLLVSSRPGAHRGHTALRISLDANEADRDALKILEFPLYKPSHSTPGDIWGAATLSLERQGTDVTMSLDLRLNWNETASPYFGMPNSRDRKETKRLIDAFLSGSSARAGVSAWSPMDFYEAAYVPPKAQESAKTIEVPGLESSLFPYQKRTLQWLLAREGVMWSPADASLRSLNGSHGIDGVQNFREAQDANGELIFVSDVLQTVTRDEGKFNQASTLVRGGILAEEMGLGKTLEVLALILLHSRTDAHPLPNVDASTQLVKSGATLIVTPESLREQWISEIGQHAPSLRVKHYQGCKKLRDGEDSSIITELAGYDIVITTYSVLSAELHFAMEPPARSRRYERAYQRATSPLVKIGWWRLCLDEAQMIENGYSQAASVARVLPRMNAWGITGTPVKDDVKDLFGLLLFLRYEPYCSSPQAWQALITDHKPIFQQIFRSISLRHTKSLVRDEILLPAQKRFVISMPFMAVEEQHYRSLFKEMADECSLELDGTPKIDDWDPEDYEEQMRIWLNRLRQTTLHPEVGLYNRRVLGYNKSRPMRTVDEVLTAMLEQSENAIRAEERSYLLSRLTRGQLYENSPRVREALELWTEVRAETERLVAEARSKFTEAIREQGGDEAVERIENINDIGPTGSDSDSDSDEGDELDNKGRIGERRRQLRSALELHHRAVFFVANAHFQIRDNKDMTEPESDEFKRLKKLEDDGYDDAKVIRREILRDSNRKASRLMAKIARKAATQKFAEIQELSVKSERGIESGRIIDGLEVLYGELNMQANVLDEWREEVVALLLRPLVDEEDDVETTGEELGDSAKFQDILMVYVTTLRAAIADRQDATSGQTNELAKHETETSLRLARAGEGPAPEMMEEMLKKRAELKPKRSEMSMRGAIGEFRGLQTRLSRDASSASREATEARIALNQLQHTQKQISSQTKAALALEAEIEFFKTAMNSRLEYYRQLQTVSDSVLPHEGPKTDEAAAKLQQNEDDLRRKLSSTEAKHRYLLNLKETGAKSSEPRMCVICQMPFVTGVLTVCGHQFCKECMTLWFKAHHNCPVCKRGLKPSNLHDIAIKPQQLQVVSENVDADAETSSSQRRAPALTKQTAIYSEFNADKLAAIQNVELDGPSFTTKVDTLVRHLLWLRESDPGAKSIVFSQYKDFLHILRNAFRRFQIGHASIDDPHGISMFKESAGTEVFLLHARAHSSGLNLVNASHVFLCEPLLNTPLELQAIARVDRIGQQHETTVWLYLVSETIEESIYNLSVQRRMEHMRRGKGARAKSAAARAKSNGTNTPELLDVNIEAANTLELEHAALSKLMSKDRSAGEMVDKGDLWQCLFGHVKAAAAGATDTRIQEKAVMSYLAGEAAAARKDKS